VAYKSNKQARAEYRENEQRNRERNQKTYQRQKEKKSWNAVVIFALIVLIILWYLGSHR